jgi:hypothetical protein
MHPSVFTMGEAPRAGAEAARRGASANDVRELLEAAGALGIRDIAGGLDITVSAAAATVEWMLSRGEARMDEWERVRAA